MAFVREVVSEGSGNIFASDGQTLYTVLQKSDLPGRARGAGGSLAAIISQRHHEDVPGSDTLFVVIGVETTEMFGPHTSLVRIEMYCGNSGSLGGAEMWITYSSRRRKLLHKTVLFNAP